MRFCTFGKQYRPSQVLIYDFDVHHGNGTEDICAEDPDVLFISTHQNNIFPGTGKASDVGRGDGEGATINVPLPGVCAIRFFFA